MGSNTPTEASITNFCRSESFLIAPRNILRESIHRDPAESCHHLHLNCKKLSARQRLRGFLQSRLWFISSRQEKRRALGSPSVNKLEKVVSTLCNHQCNRSQNPVGNTADTGPYRLSANYNQYSRSDSPLHRGTQNVHLCLGPYDLP